MENKFHFIQRTTIPMKKANVKRRSVLHVIPKRMRISTVIYNVLLSIRISLRGSGELVGPSTCFGSEFDRIVAKVWCDQKSIGWDQITKGKLIRC